MRITAVVLALVLGGCTATSPRFGSRERAETPAPGAVQHQLTGVASYYAEEFHGRPTANGEIYDMHALTAAHRTLPFNTLLKVRNLDTGMTAVVRINDRGPFKDNRVIDLSLEAARKVGLIPHGTGPVELEILEPDSTLR